MKAVLTQQAGPKAAGQRQSGGFNPRSGENRWVLGVLGPLLFFLCRSGWPTVFFVWFFICPSSANHTSGFFSRLWQRAFWDYVPKIAAKIDDEEKASEC